MLSSITRILLIFAGASLLSAVAWKTIFPGDDPYHCRTVLETGYWSDPPDEFGDRRPFYRWEPDGCMLKWYNSAEIRQCMQGRDMVFSGDPTTKEIAYAMGRLLERDEASWDRNHPGKEDSLNLTYHGVTIKYYNDTYLEMDDNRVIKALRVLRDEKERRVPIKKQKSPAFVVVGGGAWHARQTEEIAGAKEVERFKEGVHKLSQLAGDGKAFFQDPMRPVDGVGNQVFFVPPSLPKPAGLDARAKVANIIKGRVQVLQDWLHNETESLNFPQVWSITRLSLGQEFAFKRIEDTGFMAIPDIAETKAQIILNARCNAKLDRQRGPAYIRTCCSDYGIKPTPQLALVAVGLAYIAICLLCEILDVCLGRRNHWRLFNMETGAFVLALLCCYFADRTQMMGKAQKVWRGFSNSFVLFGPAILIALLTLRKSKPARKISEPLIVEADQPFMSRDQTEEWKGWMQIYILVYHYTECWKSVWMYGIVRAAVAAYLFQTGYNHTTYFLVKKDFSFRRVASVMLRLNLLTIGLAYFMKSNWLYYYFSPLCSFWFLVTYVIMAVGHKRWNEDTRLLFLKVIIFSVIISVIISRESLARWTFKWLYYIFNIQWRADGWNGRLWESMYVPYFGMLLAIANLRMKRSLPSYMRYGFVGCGLVPILAFAFNVMPEIQNNTQYAKYQPYIAVFPILAFIAFRNISPTARNYSSRAMIWVGRCSLELYILQGHLWVAADYNGTLIIPGLSTDGTIMGRFKSLAITIPIFVWLSSQTATATGNIINIILPPPSKTHTPRPAPTRRVEKDEGDEEDIDPLLEVADAIPLDGYHAGYTGYKDKKRPLMTIFSLPQFRILLLLLFFWALNLCFPRPFSTPVPDGYTRDHKKGNH